MLRHLILFVREYTGLGFPDDSSNALYVWLLAFSLALPRPAGTDRRTAEKVPDTPQTRAPAYRLAFADEDFMCREELRPVRLQLELLKPELILHSLAFR